MLQKNYKLGGLNLKSNPLNKSDSNCTDCDNITLDKEGNLVKRGGTELVIDSISSKDLIYYAAGDQVYSYAGSLKNVDTGKFIAPQGNFSLGGTTSTVDYVEYNDILYFLDNSGEKPLLKVRWVYVVSSWNEYNRC